MGCNVNCPYLPCEERADCGLDDPTGKGDDVFREAIGKIEEKVRQLAESLRKMTRRPEGRA